MPNLHRYPNSKAQHLFRVEETSPYCQQTISPVHYQNLFFRTNLRVHVGYMLRENIPSHPDEFLYSPDHFDP